MRSALVVTLGLAVMAGSQSYADEMGETLPDASACPEIFGDSGDHQDNNQRRESLLARIATGKHCMTITHSADWRVPRLVHFADLELVEIDVPEDGDPVAFFELLDNPAWASCEAATYALRVDDSIGANARILAILEDLVLVEREGLLSFILQQGAEAPDWRMVWRSPWSMPRLPSKRSSPSPSGRRKSTRRRPRKTRRTRRKRR